MTRGELIAALGKVSGRFQEGYGDDPDLRDATDLHAVADLLHEELSRVIEREVRDRVNARFAVESEDLTDDVASLRERIERFGEGE